jgi:alpha-galactosidase
MGYTSIGRITGLPADDLVGLAAGLNHFSWFLDIRRRSTGDDVYPLLRAADATYDPAYYPLTRRMFRRFGLYPHPSDDHIGEYLGYAWAECGLDGYDFPAADARRVTDWARVQGIASGERPAPGRDALHRSGEFAFPIIAGHLANDRRLIEAVNIRNDGLIANLPDWAVVEVPAVAGADGVHGVQVGALPRGIAARLHTQAHGQDLVVEAAVHGSRELALQARWPTPWCTTRRRRNAAWTSYWPPTRPICPNSVRHRGGRLAGGGRKAPPARAFRPGRPLGIMPLLYGTASPGPRPHEHTPRHPIAAPWFAGGSHARSGSAHTSHHCHATSRRRARPVAGMHRGPLWRG